MTVSERNQAENEKGAVEPLGAGSDLSVSAESNPDMEFTLENDDDEQ